MSFDLRNGNQEEVIRNCGRRTRMDTNLGAAYFDLGRSSLLLGNLPESLAAYAKACQLSETEASIEAAIESLERLQKSTEGRMRELSLAGRLLLVARASKLLSSQTGLRSAAVDGPQVARQKAAAAMAELRRLTPRFAEPLDPPIVIVAGGCDLKAAPQVNGYRTFLEAAFRDFGGTIISGGTTAGVSGTVASMHGRMKKIAYLPKRECLPSDAVPDDGYQIRWMNEEETISVSQAIQYWIDILLSDVKPSEVRLVGINGGEISAFEFRFALALGAHVGIILDSGREADRLWADPDWKSSENLFMLPADEKSVKAFVIQKIETA